MLEIRDLDVYYRNVQAIYGVSLDVQEKELLVVLGANGAGKSTLLKTISGVTTAARGTIRLQGELVMGIPPSAIVKKGICHCPEGRKVFPKMTVKKNLVLGAYTRKDRNRVKDDLQRVMGLFPILKEREDQLAGSLSGGEQLMLAIARALMGQPKLLLMDEASIGLGPILVSRVGQYIERLNIEGLTILLVEQNAKAALRLAGRAYVMESGRIVMQGNASDLANDPGIKKAYLGE